MARLEPGSDELELRCSAENRGDRTILALRYPAIQGIGPLSSDGSQDRLLHSTMMGALFFDPFHLFRGELLVPAREGLIGRHATPMGFTAPHSSSWPTTRRDAAGFTSPARTRTSGDKDLNFYKAPDDKSLMCEIAHIQGDARPGKSLVVDYPVVIAALNEGTWYAAAERYRAWAMQQPWCRRGTRRDRVAAGDASRWLLEKTGAVGAWWPFRNDIRAGHSPHPPASSARRSCTWSSGGVTNRRARPPRSDGDHFGPFYFPFLALKDQGDIQDATSQDRDRPAGDAHLA